MLDGRAESAFLRTPLRPKEAGEGLNRVTINVSVGLHSRRMDMRFYLGPVFCFLWHDCALGLATNIDLRSAQRQDRSSCFVG